MNTQLHPPQSNPPSPARLYLRKSRRVYVRQLSEDCYYVYDPEDEKEGYVVTHKVFERDYGEIV